MSVRPRRTVSRALSRRALGASAAGLTAALAAAPFAHADPTPTATGTSTSAPAAPSATGAASSGPTPSRATSSGAPAAAGASSSSARDAAKPHANRAATRTANATPNYGTQKFRVGVQQKDGSYVPPGTTLVGTKLHVVEAGGPNLAAPLSGDCTTTLTDTDTTTTSAVPAAGAQTDITSYCTTVTLTPESARRAQRVIATLRAAYAAQHGKAAAARRFRPLSTVQPGTAPPFVYQEAVPGATITVTQISAQQDLQRDPQAAVLLPCTAPANDIGGDCPSQTSIGTSGDGDSEKQSDLLMDDAGPAPVARDDQGSTKYETPVSIDVTANDETMGAPKTGLSVTEGPKHGTAAVVSGSAAPVGPTPTPTPTSTAPSAPVTTISTSDFARRAYARAVMAAAAKVGTTIRYTPKAGFSGTDRFTYRLSTGNGSATALVTIRVAAAASSSASSSPTSSSSTSGAPYHHQAVTGVDSAALGGVGSALLLTGGAALALGRRRRPARHARTH